MEPEQTGFPSFQGMDAEAGDGLQAEAKMLLLSHCPKEAERAGRLVSPLHNTTRKIPQCWEDG